MSPIVFEVVESEGDELVKPWKAFQQHGEPEYIVRMLKLHASDYPPGTVIEVRLPQEKGEEKG